MFFTLEVYRLTSCVKSRQHLGLPQYEHFNELSFLRTLAIYKQFIIQGLGQPT